MKRPLMIQLVTTTMVTSFLFNIFSSDKLWSSLQLASGALVVLMSFFAFRSLDYEIKMKSRYKYRVLGILFAALSTSTLDYGYLSQGHQISRYFLVGSSVHDTLYHDINPCKGAVAFEQLITGPNNQLMLVHGVLEYERAISPSYEHPIEISFRQAELANIMTSAINAAVLALHEKGEMPPLIYSAALKEELIPILEDALRPYGVCYQVGIIHQTATIRL